MHKSTPKILIPLVVLFFITTSCNFIKDGKNKLVHYCPGLKVDISGLNYSYKNGTKTYTFDYAASSQKNVDEYFTKKENGFTQSDGKGFDSHGFILVKTVKGPKAETEVIYSKLTQQIMTVENGE